MLCSICNEQFTTNDLIIRAVSCRILDAAFEEIEYVGDDIVLDMHKNCFEQQLEKNKSDVVEVTTSVNRTDALGCFA